MSENIFMTVECGVIPTDFRAQQMAETGELTVDEVDGWIEEREKFSIVRLKMAIGGQIMVMEQSYADPVEGFSRLMERAAVALRKRNKEKGFEPPEPEEPNRLILP